MRRKEIEGMVNGLSNRIRVIEDEWYCRLQLLEKGVEDIMRVNVESNSGDVPAPTFNFANDFGVVGYVCVLSPLDIKSKGLNYSVLVPEVFYTFEDAKAAEHEVGTSMKTEVFEVHVCKRRERLK